MSKEKQASILLCVSIISIVIGAMLISISQNI